MLMAKKADRWGRVYSYLHDLEFWEEENVKFQGVSEMLSQLHSSELLACLILLQ